MSSALLHAVPAFSDLLRNWRKIRKLSQWELSSEAGISQRHLSFLESQRSAPSREMVMLLGKALELPLREQNALLNAAGFASLFPSRNMDAADMKHARHALSVMLSFHEPYPAIVIDRNWNILMTNDANTRVFAQFVDPVSIWQDIGGQPPNILRATLHPRGLRGAIANWSEFAAYFMHQLGHELSSNPYNSEARELLDEVRGYPDVPEAASTPHSLRPCLGLELRKGDFSLEFFSMISTFGTPLDVTLQEIRIETFFPANSATEAWLRGITS